jgi:hypothetical protein
MSFPSIKHTFLLPPNINHKVYICEGKVDPLHTMKKYRGLDVQIHSFLTLELDGNKQFASHPSRFTCGENVLNVH